MNQFSFDESDKVLLLGEGNFSFSRCLLKLMTEKRGTSNFSNFYATCFQNDLSPLAILNVNFLKNQGAEVLLGVDATKLEDEPRLKFSKFNKIIFNFPHVGGKMKIHLNRALLCNFFVSCTNILTSDGKVIVTLCSGQGGTEFEGTIRRWDDTWKVVEQAAHGGFVLSHAEYFPHLLFSEYQPVGYRGREQKFSISSSVLHIFHKVKPPLRHINHVIIKNIANYHMLESSNDLSVSYAHKVAIIKSPLKRQKSPQYYLVEKLHDVFGHYHKNAGIELKLPYHTVYTSEKAPCYFKGALHSLRSSLSEVIPRVEGGFVIDGLVFQRFGSDFNSLGASCQAVVGGSLKYSIIKDFFDLIIKIFNFDGPIIFQEDENEWKVYIESNMVSQQKLACSDPHSNCITVDIDSLCLLLFKVTMKELWADEAKFDELSCRLLLPSLYPLKFCFDIAFGSITDLDEAEFLNLLHQAPDNLIDSVKLLSVYQHSNLEKSYCYRVTYISYEKPLHRKLVIDYHHNVIGKLLENILHVSVH